MKRTILYLIRIYQQLFSRRILKAVTLGYGCRFSPTCSDYTYQAVERYGTIKGLFLGFKRLTRCHPFSQQKGFDPVR